VTLFWRNPDFNIFYPGSSIQKRFSKKKSDAAISKRKPEGAGRQTGFAGLVRLVDMVRIHDMVQIDVVSVTIRPSRSGGLKSLDDPVRP